MKEKLKLKIILIIEKFGFERKVLEKKLVLEKEYLVRKGTIRNKVDKDDACLFELSKNSQNIFDVGANIGQSTMLMIPNNPKKIVLIDPNPKALSIASENLIYNNLSHKAIIYNGFVGQNSGGIVDFYTVGTGAAGSKFKSFAKTASSLDSHFKVRTLCLDEISEETRIIPDLIKIDVEGAESGVLLGSTKIAKEQKTLFFVEMHSGDELTIIENTKLILGWCKQNNYKAFYLKEMCELTTLKIESRGRYHALLIPKDKDIPEKLKNIKEGDKINYS